MNSKYATVGMRVISKSGKLGTVKAIVPSLLQSRTRLLRIMVDHEDVSDWHPSHWEPTALKGSKS